MREIKFRAWSKKFGGMIYPNNQYSISIDVSGGGVHSVWEDARDDECVPVMQFTGLKDKDGKDIYEGDIVSVPLYGKCIIIWNENICAFQYAYNAVGKGTSIGGRMTNTLYGHDSKDKFKVIGNIYETPIPTEGTK